MVFDDMIATILSNTKLNLIVIELIIRGRQLNTPLIFMTHFVVRNNVRLNSAYDLVQKLQINESFNKWNFDHLSEIDFRDFIYSFYLILYF